MSAFRFYLIKILEACAVHLAYWAERLEGDKDHLNPDTDIDDWYTHLKTQVWTRERQPKT